MDLIKRYKWPIMGLGAAALIVAFLLFRPDKLFIDDVVDESLADAFPVATEATETTTTTTTTTSPPPTTAAQGDDEPPTTTSTTTTTTTTTAPPGPVARGTGAFYGIDHRASGTATVYEQTGDYVLRFEDDTDIQNGPDLWVWVLESDNYDGGDPGAFIELGKIKGNVGGQNYALPTEFDPAVHQFVLIWCKRFSVPFAAAPLTG
ncbi:MAG: DM13 domain-containing protein [Acidimicrobiia bacterium]|nr:DM13 domain-containing protein [Acidimicrobiia bacterium]